MAEWEEEYEQMQEHFRNNPEEAYHSSLEHEPDPFGEFDDAVLDSDFSGIEGGKFKRSFMDVMQSIASRKGRDRVSPSKRIRKTPSLKDVMARRKNDLFCARPQVSNVVVPSNKPVVIKGVNDFILSQASTVDSVKNIGYYKGHKLKELVLTFNNDSAIDFELQLFNPSMPLDYLYSTSLNLNDKIQVAGGEVAYTDVLFNALANPMLIPNAKFVYSGASLSQQKSIPLIFRNKSNEGKVKIHPLNLDIEVDAYQEQGDIIFFDIMSGLNRPFIPDGMDVISYKVLAGMTVTMAFFYDQVSLKKYFYKEARDSKKLL